MSMNPEETPRMDLTARTMFEYDTHRNIPWNFLEYDPEKEYLDPADQVLQRKYSTQKKGEKSTKYATKKGFYMDYELKVAKGVPGANVYKMGDSWDGESDRKKSSQKKIDPKVIKYTFIERIEIEQKNRKRPGICAYNINKTDAEIKADIKKMAERKMSEGQKRYFYEDTEYVSNLVPGAGSHNPHEIQHRDSLNKTDHKFWIAKHKKEGETYRKKRASEPDVGTYKPLPALYTTFTKLSVTPREKIEKKNGFGTDEKFAYLREAKVKSKIKEVRPSAATYNTFIDWPLKTDKEGLVNKHKVNWHNRISKGFSQSVYH